MSLTWDHGMELAGHERVNTAIGPTAPLTSGRDIRLPTSGTLGPYAWAMTIQRMDHVGVIADDLETAITVLVELGMELEGEMPVEGR